jgi:hypothetical protein
MVARTSAGAEVASELLRRYRRSYAEELGIDRLDRPSDLFRLLVLALLMSARIRASIAVDAAAALFRERWRTARAMADASWEARARTLNRAGYARYDERTSTMLGETSALLLDRYKGDLRRLREGRPSTSNRMQADQGMRRRRRPHLLSRGAVRVVRALSVRRQTCAASRQAVWAGYRCRIPRRADIPR